MKSVKVFWCHRDIDLAPINGGFCLCVFDDKFVVRRASGVLSCDTDQSAVFRQRPFVAADGSFNQLGCAEIPVDRPPGAEPVLVDSE